MAVAPLLELRLLGTLEVHRGEQRLSFPTRHCGFLLAMLVLSPDQCLNRGLAAARLWSERADAQAKASLRQTLYHLKQTLGDAHEELLQVDRHLIALRARQCACDVIRLQQALDTDPETAVALYTGELLAGCGRTDNAFESWLAAERRQLAARITRALHALSVQQASAGRFRALENTAQLLLQLDSFDEQGIRARLLALAGQGRKAAMLQSYEVFALELDSELGSEPEPETQALLAKLRHAPLAASPDAQPLQDPDPDRSAVTFEERRTLSILAFIPPFDSRDPETVREVLRAARGKAEAVIAGAGGVITEVQGDALIACFGTGSGAETHAVDAVHCAVALLEPQLSLDLRVGVAAGEVILLNEAATVIPDSTTLGVLAGEAISLAHSARRGQVRVSPTVATRVSAQMVLAEAPDGRGLLVTDATPPSSLAYFSCERLRARFVARDTELGALQNALGQACRGHGRVVGIVGEAGIGKSRLVAEFLASLDAAPCRQLAFHTSTSDRSSPFASLRVLLRAWLGDCAPAEIDQTAIEKRLRVEGLPLLHLAPLRALAGLPTRDWRWQQLAASKRRLYIIDAVRAIVDAQCRRSPLVLTIEDLHWCDAETESLLNRFVDDLPLLPLLILATYRPEYTPRWVHGSAFHQIRLEALSDHHSLLLLDSLLGDDPDMHPLKQRLLERTAGIPMFIEESVKSLIDQGDIQGTPGRYRLAGTRLSFSVPATINDVLIARIAQLQPDQRLLLQVAAVFFKEAPESLLQRFAELTGGRFVEAVRALRRAELLDRIARADTPAYRFRHALIHEVAYRSLLKADRQRLHALVLDYWSAERDDGAQGSRAHDLAYHAWHAGDMDRAALWWRRAGDHCVELSAYSQAADAYAQALEAVARCNTPSVKDELDIRLRLRPVLVPQGRFLEAIAHLEAAEALLSAHEAPQHKAQILVSKSYTFSTHGRLRQAVSAAEQAAQLADEKSQLAYEAVLARAQALSLVGDWHHTIESLVPTVPFWEAHRTERFGHTGTRSVWCHGHLARAYSLHGEFAAAQDHVQRAMELSRETARPVDQIFAEHRLGEMLMLSDRSAEALPVLENALQKAEEHVADATIFHTWLACDLVPACVLGHRLDRAESILSMHVDMASRLDLRQFSAWMTLRQAQLSMARDDVIAGMTQAENAYRIATEIGDRVLQPVALRTMACATLAHGSRLFMLQRALQMARKRGLHAETVACECALNSMSAD